MKRPTEFIPVYDQSPKQAAEMVEKLFCEIERLEAELKKTVSLKYHDDIVLDARKEIVRMEKMVKVKNSELKRGYYRDMLIKVHPNAEVPLWKYANQDPNFMLARLCALSEEHEHWRDMLMHRANEITRLNDLIDAIDTALSIGANPDWDDNRRILEAAKLLGQRGTFQCSD